MTSFISDRELEKNVKKTNAVYKMESGRGRKSIRSCMKHDSCEGFASPRLLLGKATWEGLEKLYSEPSSLWDCPGLVTLVTVDVE